MSDFFFKSHFLVSHLAFALALFLFVSSRLVNDQVLGRKLFRSGAGILTLVSLWLCSSGLGLLLRGGPQVTGHIVHGVAGAMIYLISVYAYFYHQRGLQGRLSAVIFAGVILVVGLGVVNTFGQRYFLKPQQYSIVSQQVESVKSFHKVVEKKCIKCHNQELRAGGLDWADGTDIKKAFLRRRPADSKMYWRALESPLSRTHMPMFSGVLSKDELKMMESWINEGGVEAERPDERSPSSHDKKSRHWALSRFSKPPVPEVKTKNLVINEIDQFLISSMERSEKVDVKPIAEDLQKKRLALVMTGLHPTSADFKMPYDTLKREYLKSLAFAETLSLFWMDLTAFADDDGVEPDRNHEIDTLSYRNYLLNAFQKDRPYFSLLRDHFVSFKRKSKTNFKSLFEHIPHNTQEELTVDSAIVTAFSMTLGLDMRCARCHDHPNEPISNENYYELAVGFEGQFERPVAYKMRRIQNAMPPQNFPSIYEGDSGRFTRVEDLGERFTDSKNGLGYFTARVFVDNVWRSVFGKGITNEESGFSSKSPEPRHLALLNWLTYDFLEHGTSIKHLVDKMVSSQAFRSRMGSSPDGEIFTSRLLRTELIRDNLLRSAKALKSGASPLKKVDLLQPLAKSATLKPQLRSVHMFRTRTITDDSLDLVSHFGLSKRFSTLSRLDAPSDIDQSLFFLNAEYLTGLLKKLSSESLRARSDFDQEIIQQAYEKVLFRKPQDQEVQMWLRHYNKGLSLQENTTEMYRVLLSSNEFLYIP